MVRISDQRGGVCGDCADASGSVNYENATNERGERFVWLERGVVDRLRSLRAPGESFSDVILRVAAEGWLGGRMRHAAAPFGRAFPHVCDACLAEGCSA